MNLFEENVGYSPLRHTKLSELHTRIGDGAGVAVVFTDGYGLTVIRPEESYYITFKIKFSSGQSFIYYVGLLFIMQSYEKRFMCACYVETIIEYLIVNLFYMLNCLAPTT